MFIIIKKQKSTGNVSGSQFPAVHPDLATAMKETERLAKENIHHEFYAMQAVSVSSIIENPVETRKL